MAGILCPPPGIYRPRAPGIVSLIDLGAPGVNVDPNAIIVAPNGDDAHPGTLVSRLRAVRVRERLSEIHWLRKPSTIGAAPIIFRQVMRRH